MSPLDVLNLIVEDGNEASGLALVHSDVLKIVLAIVALSGRVVKVLGPHQDGMARRCRQHLNILRSWAGNIEFGSLQIAVEVVHIDQAVVFGV